MLWFFVTLGGLVLGVGALWWWGRAGREDLDDMPGIVPSGRAIRRRRVRMLSPVRSAASASDSYWRRLV